MLILEFMYLNCFFKYFVDFILLKHFIDGQNLLPDLSYFIFSLL
jgi:hypothetical protein